MVLLGENNTFNFLRARNIKHFLLCGSTNINNHTPPNCSFIQT